MCHSVRGSASISACHFEKSASASGDFSRIETSIAAIFARSPSVVLLSSGVRAAMEVSSMPLRKAYMPKYSSWVSGSYLWVWHCAHWAVRPRVDFPIASMRSKIPSMRNCSGFAPPSSLVIEFRRNPVAMRSSCVASGSRSPAICFTTNSSYGMSVLIASTTQSR